MKESILKIDNIGTKRYYLDDKLHREDGPAVEHFDGHKEWWVNGLLHREDGPAVECTNGNKSWYRNGIRHRENAPAIERSDGTKEWHYQGKYIKCYSQEEFEKIMKLKAFW